MHSKGYARGGDGVGVGVGMGIIIEYRMREKGFGRRMCLVYIPVHSLQERVGKSLGSARESICYS